MRELDVSRRENGRYKRQIEAHAQEAAKALESKQDNVNWMASYRGVVSRSSRKWDSLEQLINKASGRMLSISERAPKMKNQMDQLLRVMQQIQQGGRQIIETHDKFSRDSAKDGDDK